MATNGGFLVSIITACAAVASALAMPFIVVFQYLTGKRAEQRDAALAANVTKIKEHTDGMVGKIEALAEQKGHKEGIEHATAAAEEKAATLAEGQAKGIEIARAGAQMKEEDKP